MDNQLKELLLTSLNKCYKDNKKLSFILFFILFTMARRQNFMNILELVDEYDEMYNIMQL